LPLSGAGIAPALVSSAVAELYRLAKPMLAETFVEWFDRVRSGQAEVLRGSVLPFASEKLPPRSSPAARFV
jgi:hypothetical protein